MYASFTIAFYKIMIDKWIVNCIKLNMPCNVTKKLFQTVTRESFRPYVNCTGILVFAQIEWEYSTMVPWALPLRTLLLGHISAQNLQFFLLLLQSQNYFLQSICWNRFPFIQGFSVVFLNQAWLVPSFLELYVRNTVQFLFEFKAILYLLFL